MDDTIYRNHTLRHSLETGAILAAMALLTGALGALFAGLPGFFWALAAAMFVLISSTRWSGALALRFSGARELSPWLAPDLHSLVRQLAQRAGLPQAPRLFLLPVSVPQAMAVGGGAESALAVSPALLKLLSGRELAGVLAHEIAHMRNGDLRLMTAARVFAQFARVMSGLGTLLLLASLLLLLAGQPPVPILAILLLWWAPRLMDLLFLALSRSREHAADLGAAELTRDPRALASALTRIENTQHQRPWWTRLFPWAGPLRTRQPDPWLLSHPPTAERVRRLLALERQRPSAPHATRTQPPPPRDPPPRRQVRHGRVPVQSHHGSGFRWGHPVA